MFFHEKLNWCTIKFPIAESSNLRVLDVQYNMTLFGLEKNLLIHHHLVVFFVWPVCVETCAKLTYD